MDLFRACFLLIFIQQSCARNFPECEVDYVSFENVIVELNVPIRDSHMIFSVLLLRYEDW